MCTQNFDFFSLCVSYAAIQGEETFVRGESSDWKYIELVFIADDHVQDRASGGGRSTSSV